MLERWSHYVSVSVRTLARHKSYAFINIFGLALGLAAALLILLNVRYELGYDRWIPNSDRIFQLQASLAMGSGEPERTNTSPHVAAAALAKDFPQIERVTGASPTKAILGAGPEPLFVDALTVDPDFLSVFDFRFEKGDGARALSTPGSIVLTRKESARLFGDLDPVGRTISWNRKGEARELKVTGILADLPENTHLKFGALVSRDSQVASAADPMGGWGQIDTYVYAKLRKGADPATVTSALSAFEARNIPKLGPGASFGDFIDFQLVPIRDIHLHHSYGKSAMRPIGDKATIAAFAVIALSVLAIACINFVNLATARASQRALEVGLRKVVGASRGQLVVQFLGEAVMLVAAAMLIALALVELSLPAFGGFLGAELRLSYLGPDGLLLPLIALTLAIGAAAGLYPAYVLSRFEPSHVLRISREGGSGGSGRLRNLLVVGQFAVSIGLIACTAIIYAQTVHARSADPGFRQEGLLVVKNLQRLGTDDQREALRRELAGLPGAVAASAASVAPAMDMQQETIFTGPGGKDNVYLPYANVDPHYFAAMGTRLLAGRLFSDRVATDSADSAGPALMNRGVNIVVSASAARRLGYSSPAAAIGKPVKAALASQVVAGGGIGMVPATIVGVVGDTRFRSLRDKPWPGVFVQSSANRYYALVRFSSPDPAALRDGASAAWRKIAPEIPFEAAFTEDEVAGLYRGEESQGRLFAAFALLAMVIGCLGLYGLAAFTGERRTKEIGVRKVFGATTTDIVRLLVWQFSKPVVLANLLAWPVAWWLMRDWLNGFAERIALHPGWFLGAGLVAYSVAALTIGGHAVRIARLNPVHALRYE